MSCGTELPAPFVDVLPEYAQRYTYESLLGDTDPRLLHAGDAIRARGHILRNELYQIARWKSPRRADLVNHNLPETVERVTNEALVLKGSDPGRAVRLLDGLCGIGVPTASAVLTVADPQNFGIVDVRVWKVLSAWQPNRFPYERRNRLQVADFLCYLETIRELARASRLTCREVDMALWQMDRERSSRSKDSCSSEP